MTRIVAIIALLLAALLAPSAQAQGGGQGWTGDWHGTLETPNGSLRLGLTIRQSEDGALAAELESLDQAPGQKIPVGEIAISGGRMTFTIPAIGARYEGNWIPAENRFSGSFTQGAAMPLDFLRGGAAARPAIAGLDGRWEGGVKRGGVVLRLILRVATTESGGTVALLDSPDMMALGLPVAQLARDGQVVSFSVPAGGSQYRGTLTPDGARMTGVWSRAGSADAEVSFTRVAVAATPRARPQQPKPPFPYRTEDVSFENLRAPGVRLAGTLTIPEGRGPFPAAILISGSGPQDRDETIFWHRPFAVLADHLTRNGVAVLRYDDRGFAGSTGTQAGATSADFAGDANAAFAFLRKRREVDPRAIGFVGHSEGGLIGPLAMAENKEVAFLIMLAGPGTTTRQLIESQRRALGRAQGVSEAELNRGAPLQHEITAIAASGRDDADARSALGALLTDERMVAAGISPATRGALIDRVLDPWFRYFARYDPAPALARIRVPVLALNGSLDQQVVPGENLAGIRAALARNRDVTIVELPGINHMLQRAQTGSVGEYADIEETVAPVVLDTIARWIAAHFPARRSQ